jgi:predicted flap endonuclease-1-like 5' DNA nuclease
MVFPARADVLVHLFGVLVGLFAFYSSSMPLHHLKGATMSLNLNPWLALLLGIFIGWILEWLLEVWFFRRKRVEAQRHLAELEARLRTCDHELRLTRTQVDSLRAELAARLAASSVVIVSPAPTEEVETPQAEAAPPAEDGALGLAVLGAVAAGEAEAEARPAAEEGETAISEAEVAAGEAEAAAVESGVAAVEAEVAVAEAEAAAVEAEVAAVEAEVAAGESEDAAAETEVIAVEAEAEVVETEVAAGETEVAVAEAEAAAVETEVAAEQAESGVAAEIEAVQAEGAEVEVETGGLGAAAAVAAGLAGVAAGAVLADEPTAEATEVVEPATPPPGEEMEPPAAALTMAAAHVPEAELAAAGPEAVTLGADLSEANLAAELPAADLTAGLPQAEFVEAHLSEQDLEIERPQASSGWEVAAGALAAGAVGVLAGTEATDNGEVAVTTAAVPEAEVMSAPVEAAVSEALPETAEASVAEPGDLVGEAEPRDNLTLIHGIGPKFSGQLAAVGITSFAALAAATPERVRQAVTHPTWQKVDYAAWIAEAKVWVDQAESAGDHLLSIEGIGPVYAAKLRAAGITTFAQLADTDEARLAEIIQAPSWRRVDFSEWRAQARLGAARDQAGLVEFQSKLSAPMDRDNLDLVAGISPKTVDALAAAGITTFAALAAATPEQLDHIVTGAGGRPGDYAAWIAEADLRAAGKHVARPKAPEPCPQDLSRVEGIGSVYEAKLYAGGIGTYWQLSELADAELAYILDVQDFQRVDLAGIKADAARLAAETETVGRTWDGTPPDDFDLIEGIGDVYEGRLYDAGICTFEALAEALPDRLDEICAAPEFNKPDYAAWIATAKSFLRKRERGVKHLVSCPQDMSRVKGVGSIYEQKLYAASIGSYWELGNRTEGELRQILELKEFQKVDVAGMKADAQRLAEETRTVGRGWTGAAPDDFELLEGIGATYEGRLYAAGICTFRALAEATVERLTEICKAPAFRVPDYANWIAQAKVILTQRGR